MTKANRARINTEVVVSDKALAFLRGMVAAGDLDVENLLDLLEKPWKWEDEYLTWLSRGENA